jgi:alpha/beta superfamily hydrolase
MKAFLIPGSGENLKSRNYQAVLNIYKCHGYDPVFVPIKWRYSTIKDWTKQVEATISKKELADSLLSGFSFGAMIAFNVAANTNPKQLFLFSLSPYFKEDMPLPKKYEMWAGKRRIAAFRELSFNQLATSINCPTTIFLGSKESKKYADMRRRREEAHKHIKNSELISVADTAHDVSAPHYLEAIDKKLNS